MKTIGVDYCYAYTWATPDVNVQRSRNMAQRAAAADVARLSSNGRRIRERSLMEYPSSLNQRDVVQMAQHSAKHRIG
jgi:hypothetical protein